MGEGDTITRDDLLRNTLNNIQDNGVESQSVNLNGVVRVTHRKMSPLQSEQFPTELTHEQRVTVRYQCGRYPMQFDDVSNKYLSYLHYSKVRR